MTLPEAIFYSVAVIAGCGVIALMVMITARKGSGPATPPPRAVTVPTWQWTVPVNPERSQIDAARLLVRLMEQDGEAVPDELRKLAEA